MAIGDAANIQARLLRQMPPWFSSGNSIAAAVMSGGASVLALIYGMWVYVVAQTRLATCSGGFLDLFAQDYFGTTLVRRDGQTDAAFKLRIQALLLSEKGTRRGMVKALTILTGNPPKIWEPTTPSDNGGYRTPCMGYGVAGAYASIALGAQCLITANLGTTQAPSNLSGYRTAPAGYSSAGTAYAAASSIGQIAGGITAQDVIDTINLIRPAGVACWVNITNGIVYLASSLGTEDGLSLLTENGSLIYL